MILKISKYPQKWVTLLDPKKLIAFLEKQGKKYGAQVGETQVPTDRSTIDGMPSMYQNKETVRYLDITPEMRKAIQKGQPIASIQNELAKALA